MLKYDDYSDYDKWSEEFYKNSFDEQELEELVEIDKLVDESDISESEIWDRINKCWDGDLDTRHNQILNVLKEIREEYNLEEF